MRFLFGFIFSACLSLSFCENLTSISSSTSVETTENTVSSSGTIVKDYLVEREINITTIITTNTTVYLSWEKSGADDDEYQLKLKAGEPLFEIDEGKCTIDDDSKNITTKDTEYTFEHLKPYYRYNVTIQYDTNIQEYSAETKASTPGNIQNLTCKEDKFILTATWSLPCDVNGNLKQFNIQLNGKYNEDSSDEHKNSTNIPYENGKLDYEIEFTLRPSMDYEIRINAENEGNLISESEIQTFTTEEIVPGKPRDLQIKESATNLSLTWKEPLEMNGKIIYYEIELIDNGPLYERKHNCEEINKSNTYNTSELAFEIDDLNPYFDYSIILSAANSAGLGEPVELSKNTEEAAPEEVSSFKSSVSNLLNLDEFNVNISFRWETPCDINGILDNFKVKIIETGEEFTTNYEEGLETFDTTVTSSSLNLTSYKTYTAEIRAFLHNGEFSEPKEIQFSTPEFIPEPINEISIEKITSTKAEFKWSPPEMNGKFVNYEITINIDGPLYPVDKTKCEINRTSITKNHKEYHFSYEDFLPFYNYSISVKACTNVGCGSEYSQTFETLSMSPKAPTNLSLSTLNDIITVDTYNVSKTITWDDPCLQNGPINYYEIVIDSFYTEDESNCTQIRVQVYFNVKNEYSFDVEPSRKYTVSIYGVIANQPAIDGESAEINFTSPVAYPSTVTDIQNQPNSSTITINWSEPETLNGKIEKYKLELIDNGPKYEIQQDCTIKDNSKTNETTNTYYTFDDLSPFSFYVVKISAKTGAGCGPEQNISSETFSDTPEPVRNLSLTLDNSIEAASISWTAPCRMNGELSHFALTLTEENTENQNEIKVFYVKSINNYNFNFKDLKSNTNYTLTVSAISKDNLVSESEQLRFKFPIRAADSQKLLIILLSTLIPLFFVTLVLIYVIRKKRHLKSSCPHDSPPDSKDSKHSTPKTSLNREFIKDKYFNFYKKITADPQILKEQYTAIEDECKTFEHTSNFALKLENRRKNRYINILPFDATRVCLKIDEDDEMSTDYINASYIKGYSGQNEYIATQGPLRVTCKDFWNMILENNVTVIAMVAQFMEQGKEKCFYYIPSNYKEIILGNDFKITCSTALSFTSYTVRTFLVEKGDLRHSVTHFQYLEWPDFGVPSNSESILRFAGKIRERVEADGGLIAVHCSAGVGRTGTLISIDILLQMLNKESRISIYNVVLDLRKQRARMVQTETQYTFIHTCIHDYLLNPSIEDEEVYEEQSEEPIYEDIEECKEKYEEIVL